jgi:hypothetical protein
MNPVLRLCVIPKLMQLCILNDALYLDSCALIGTGLLLELRLDNEDGARRLLGINPDDWGEIHLAVAILFVVLGLLHLLINWAWIKAALTKAKPAYLIVWAGLGLIGLLLFWPTEHSWPPELLD